MLVLCNSNVLLGASNRPAGFWPHRGVCELPLPLVGTVQRKKSGIPAAINGEMRALDGVRSNSQAHHLIATALATWCWCTSWHWHLFTCARSNSHICTRESVSLSTTTPGRPCIYIVIAQRVHVDYFTRVTCSLTSSKLCVCWVSRQLLINLMLRAAAGGEKRLQGRAAASKAAIKAWFDNLNSAIPSVRSTAAREINRWRPFGTN